jgi:hypothetical protein
MQFENRLPADAIVARARQGSSNDSWRRRIAATISSVWTSVVTDLAFATAGMYPELFWPLIDCVNQRDSTEGPLSGRRAGERNGLSRSHEKRADLKSR